MKSQLSFAQDSQKPVSKSSSQQQIERACLEAIAELESKRKEVETLRAQHADKDLVIKAQNAQVDALKQAIGFLESAIKSGDRAGNLDREAIGQLKAQVERYKDELNSVRAERDAARSRARWYLTIGLIVGAVLGFLGANR